MHPKTEDFLQIVSHHALMVPWEDSLVAQFGVKTTKHYKDDTVLLVHDDGMVHARQAAENLGLERITTPHKNYLCDRSSRTVSYSLGSVPLTNGGHYTTREARLVLVPMSWAGVQLSDIKLPDDIFEEWYPNHLCTLKIESLCRILLRLATRGRKMSKYTVVYGSQLRNVLLCHVYGKTMREVWIPGKRLSEKHNKAMEKGLKELKTWAFITPEERTLMERIVRDRIPVSELHKQASCENQWRKHFRQLHGGVQDF